MLYCDYPASQELLKREGILENVCISQYAAVTA
jgi:hypothetical protein